MRVLFHAYGEKVLWMQTLILAREDFHCEIKKMWDKGFFLLFCIARIFAMANNLKSSVLLKTKGQYNQNPVKRLLNALISSLFILKLTHWLKTWRWTCERYYRYFWDAFFIIWHLWLWLLAHRLLFFQWFSSKTRCACFGTALNARNWANLHCLRLESQHSDIPIQSLIWMTMNLQIGWHRAYLTSTQWHGNPAAFNWRCHFPTSTCEFPRNQPSPGGFSLTGSRRGGTGAKAGVFTS